MIQRQRAVYAAALGVSDTVAITGAFLLAYWLRFRFQVIPVRDLPGHLPTLTAYLPFLAIALVILPLLIASMRLYRLSRTNARVESYLRLAGAIIGGVVLTAALHTLLWRPERLVDVDTGDGSVFVPVPEFQLSRMFLLLFMLATLALTLTGRLALQSYLDRQRRAGRNVKRVLIAGTGPLARIVVDKVRLHEEFGFDVVGMLDDGEGESYRGVPVLGPLEQAREFVREHEIDQVYVALSLSAHEEILQLLHDVSHEMVEVKVVPDLLQYITLRAGVEDLDGVPIVNLSRVPMEGFPAIFKRAFDILFAGGCLLLFAPLFPLIVVAVKVTSRGPIFYRQQRMGLDGRPFELIKFRSMVVNAEAGTGPVWADDGDSRCTPIGAMLRKLSLDELPQFWNILRGDMSLVGPRPERPFFVDRFRQKIPHYMLRHRVRAGLTGWAQVHGWRGNTSLEKRIEYDLYYVENWSLALDFKILWMTVTNGMVHEHAY